MSNVGNYVAAAAILGPLAWRKIAQWRFERKERQQAKQRAGSTRKQKRFDSLSVRRPSNVLILLAAILLLLLHGCALLWPPSRLYTTDLFRLLGLQANTPIAYLRARAAALPFDNVSWKASWGEEGLELLLRRLSSVEGRKLHLALGIEPFVACSFCTLGDDYRLYAGMRRLGAYAVQLLLFGIMTMRHDALEILDETVYSVIEFFTGRLLQRDGESKGHGEGDIDFVHAQGIRIREDRNAWRRPVMYFISIFATAELSVFTSIIDTSISGSRWDHIHFNVRLTWHLFLFLMTIVVLSCPQTPMVHPVHDIVHLLQQAKRHTDESLAQVQGAHLTQQILWGDAGLRQHVADWHEARDDAFVSRLSVAELARLTGQVQRAGLPAAMSNDGAPALAARNRPTPARQSDIIRQLNEFRELSRAAARQMWLRSARNWQRATLSRPPTSVAACSDSNSASAVPSTPESPQPTQSTKLEKGTVEQGAKSESESGIGEIPPTTK